MLGLNALTAECEGPTNYVAQLRPKAGTFLVLVLAKTFANWHTEISKLVDFEDGKVMQLRVFYAQGSVRYSGVSAETLAAANAKLLKYEEDGSAGVGQEKFLVLILVSYPEGFTYFELARRLKAAFPSPEDFKLCVFEENGRYAGIGDASALGKTAKLKAREEDRTKFEPSVETSFPGLDKRPLRLRNGRQSFSLSGDQIQSRGKELGIPITETWWMNIQLLMHEHFLTISSKQLNHLIDARNDFVASGGIRTAGSKQSENPTFILHLRV